MIDNVLPKEFLYRLCGYCGDCSCLDPFCKVFHRHKGVLKVALRGGKWYGYIKAPTL